MADIQFSRIKMGEGVSRGVHDFRIDFLSRTDALGQGGFSCTHFTFQKEDASGTEQTSQFFAKSVCGLKTLDFELQMKVFQREIQECQSC